MTILILLANVLMGIICTVWLDITRHKKPVIQYLVPVISGVVLYILARSIGMTADNPIGWVMIVTPPAFSLWWLIISHVSELPTT